MCSWVSLHPQHRKANDIFLKVDFDSEGIIVDLNKASYTFIKIVVIFGQRLPTGPQQDPSSSPEKQRA